MPLAGTEMARSARASFAYDPRTGRAMLLTEGLPPAPAGKEYQLWFITDPKHPVPGSVFKTDAEGRAMMHEQIPMEGRTASVFAITLEPAGGMKAPTSTPYLVGSAS